VTVADETARVVRIERTYEATTEEVFDAWTSPEVIARWFKPAQGWQEASAEVDLRVGGRVRVVMRDPDGEPVSAEGEYTLIDRPNKLAFTWTFEDDPSNEQMIEIEFTERDDATMVVFVNSDISEAERRDAQDEGWNTCFDEMARVLASK